MSPLDGKTPKYVVLKHDGKPPCETCGRIGTLPHPSVRYLVLKPATDVHARQALVAYLMALKQTREPDKMELAKQLATFFEGAILTSETTHKYERPDALPQTVRDHLARRFEGAP